jgi:hypothetical protein
MEKKTKSAWRVVLGRRRRGPKLARGLTTCPVLCGEIHLTWTNDGVPVNASGERMFWTLGIVRWIAVVVFPKEYYIVTASGYDHIAGGRKVSSHPTIDLTKRKNQADRCYRHGLADVHQMGTRRGPTPKTLTMETIPESLDLSLLRPIQVLLTAVTLCFVESGMVPSNTDIRAEIIHNFKTFCKCPFVRLPDRGYNVSWPSPNGFQRILIPRDSQCRTILESAKG